MKLYTTLKNEIIKNFHSIEVTFDDQKKLITIFSIHKDIGNINIQDDYDELTVFVGSFTHWHSSYYNAELANIEQLNQVVFEVIEYLKDMFNDKIFMWGTAKTGGGTKYIEKGFYPKNEGYVWSGPYKK